MLAIPLIVSVILILCFWWLADAEPRTKVILTLIWAACSAGWLFTEYWLLFAVALTILDGILWWMAFGPSTPGRL